MTDCIVSFIMCEALSEARIGSAIGAACRGPTVVSFIGAPSSSAGRGPFGPSFRRDGRFRTAAGSARHRWWVETLRDWAMAGASRIDALGGVPRPVIALGGHHPDGYAVPLHLNRRGRLMSGLSGVIVLATLQGTWVTPRGAACGSRPTPCTTCGPSAP